MAPATRRRWPSFSDSRCAVASSIATEPALVGRCPWTAEKSSKRGGSSDAAKLGAEVFRRLPCALNSVAIANTSPAATATPGTRRTRSSVAWPIVAVCTAALAPRPWWGTTTTARFCAPVAKIVANEWSIVSVRM